MSKNYEVLQKIGRKPDYPVSAVIQEEYKPEDGPELEPEIAKLPAEVIEEYLCLKNNLFARDDRPKSLLFTSVMPGEGTSTISTEFGAALTLMSPHRILLIDGNLRSPGIHKFLGFSNLRGLADVISGRLTLEQALQNSRLKNLYILPAGTTDLIPLQLFDTDRFNLLMDEVRQQFDQIILDAPAVNWYPDAMALAPKCDGVILVVQAGKTEQKSLLEANRRLTNAQGRVLGVVLNKYKNRTPFGRGY